MINELKGKICCCFYCKTIYVNKNNKQSCEYCEYPITGYWETKEKFKNTFMNLNGYRFIGVKCFIRKKKKKFIRKRG